MYGILDSIGHPFLVSDSHVDFVKAEGKQRRSWFFEHPGCEV
jgi:hypothetical protein